MATTKKTTASSTTKSTTKKKAAAKSSSKNENQIKLNIDFDKLMTMLPAVLSLIGTVTKKDADKGHFEVEKKSDSGNMMGFLIDLVAGKSGGTELKVATANESAEEESTLSSILSTLGKLL